MRSPRSARLEGRRRGKPSFARSPWGDRLDVFLYQPVGENAYWPAAVTFSFGADRRAAAATVENLDSNGQGRFIRIRDRFNGTALFLDKKRRRAPLRGTRAHAWRDDDFRESSPGH